MNQEIRGSATPKHRIFVDEDRLIGLVSENDINFPRWQKSPPGLSAQGFKKIGKVEGGQEALQSFRTAKKP